MHAQDNVSLERAIKKKRNCEPLNSGRVITSSPNPFMGSENGETTSRLHTLGHCAITHLLSSIPSAPRHAMFSGNIVSTGTVPSANRLRTNQDQASITNGYQAQEARDYEYNWLMMPFN